MELLMLGENTEIREPKRRYWRIILLKNNSTAGTTAMSATEVHLLNNIIEGNIAINGEARASSAYGTKGYYDAAKAFDGDNNTYWSSVESDNIWLEYIFIEPVEINILTFKSRINSYWREQSPVSMVVQSSLDGEEYEYEWSIEVKEDWSMGEVKEFIRPGYILDDIISPNEVSALNVDALSRIEQNMDVSSLNVVALTNRDEESIDVRDASVVTLMSHGDTLMDVSALNIAAAYTSSESAMLDVSALNIMVAYKL